MDKHYRTLLSRLERIEPPATLQRDILRAIAMRKKLQLLGFGAMSLASFGATLSVAFMLARDVAASGFFSYASLLMDTWTMRMYSQQVGMALIETLPALDLALFLTALTLAVWSLLRAVITAYPSHRYGF